MLTVVIEVLTVVIEVLTVVIEVLTVRLFCCRLSDHSMLLSYQGEVPLAHKGDDIWLFWC